MAVTSGLNTIHIAPRTPKTPRTPWTDGDGGETEEVQLSLLGEEDRRQAALGLGDTEEQGYPREPEIKRPLSVKDKRGIILLIVLCEIYIYFISLFSVLLNVSICPDLIQGVPVSVWVF